MLIQLGVQEQDISETLATKIVENISFAEASAAADAAVEKAIHKAAKGDFQTVGKLIREHLQNGANNISRDKIAMQYVPIGIRKSEQARENG